MHHDSPLVSTIVAGLVLAFIFGMIANRFRLPPLVGYLLAGVVVGPYTPGFVANQALGAELAEIGVILLMFGVGLHFSLKDLMSVRALAIPGALAQIALATALGFGMGSLMGWEMGAALLFGLALSCASTVVLLKAMQDRRLIETERGRIAVGWLIVEDLAMVLALVLIPAFAALGGIDSGIHDPFVSFVERLIGGPVGIWGVLALTVVKLGAFVGFMLIVGRRIIPWALHATAHTGSRELFRLAVLAIALGVALGSAVLFGVSLALGAFFAGMILSESELSHRAAQETLPLRDAFAVLFFVSVGMLFDPSIILTDPLPVLATVFIIVIGKSLAAFAIVLAFKRPLSTALTISASLAQIGEFSFILASMGVALTILPKEAQDLILAGALISIVLNPLLFWAADVARPGLEARLQRHRVEPVGAGVRVEPGAAPADAGAVDAVTPEAAAAESVEVFEEDVIEPSKQTGHTVLVGFGRVGSVVGEGLHAAGAPLVVIEDADQRVAAARGLGIEVVVGNAAGGDMLKLANLPDARCLLVAIPNAFEAGQVVEQGRKLCPPIRIIARAHSEEEEAYLSNLGADRVIMGEREIGIGMLAWLMGERDDAAAAMTAEVPPEPEPPLPRLAPTENLLAQASGPAVVIAVAEPVLDEASVGVEPAETAADAEPVEAEASPGLASVAVVEPAAEGVDITADPVVIEAVEAASTESVIILPPPEAPLSAAELESVATTPRVGEAPLAVEPEQVDDVAEPEAATVPAIADLAGPNAEDRADSDGATDDASDAEEPAAPVIIVPPVEPEPKG
ncbi:Kef-type potassium/proton antiporter, CPA2 family (TC 2.A.37.1) [Devosia limi DSM 17137]|uniref:Kef-type potassium/proton antiporter, CPA2 family (TC 2.A.37.1) n=1 Tax=Devosia limi DSM 17137 TaxID=1121477 RepID=A0A1M5D9H0_9HYPH|nr:Kef-type potassium/proton antiporter, CPA2 family (TC 2.A.37.1) [Devosia limi DSM 17137]